ncbi:MAG: hypothetical protein ACREMV_01500 [Gemmatimonadales bacterium]
MLVQEQSGTISCEPGARGAWFGIDARTRVVQAGAQVDTASLTLGRRVSVWAEDVVLESCPPITYAAEVKLEAL